ncbi:DNA polymerase [Trueperella pyogenes]|uniref:DNA polymerase n=1 Tax=Trueperella pyogenes TaxID=1661 RepID=UPI003248BAC1
MTTISCDLETFSPVNLTKSGVYPYAEHPDFDILLFGYSIDGGPVQVIDLASGDELPVDVLAALVDPRVVKWAFNAAFERVCLSTWLARHHPELMAGRRFLDPAQWRCTMVWSAYLGLPMSLDQVGTVLDLPVRKDSAGKKLIRQFCTPAKPSVFNQGGMRNPPASDPDGWEQFISYNRRDVEVELAIHDRLADFPLPVSEWDTYALDQQINDTGILLDGVLVDHAVACDRQHRAATLARAQDLTGLANPNSPIQLKEWLSAHGCHMTSLTKTEVATALETATGDVREALELRGELAKSSVKKYEAMQHVAGSDGRGRGFLQFYGAGRTGRFAGRLVQVQNLPRNYLPDLAQARSLVRGGLFDAVEMLYESVPDTLSQLIRTAFIPTSGHRFVVADFSAIEARVIAWLAGETTTLNAFKEGKDLYCETASRMFGVPVEKHGINAELRQKGKIAVLACIAEGQWVLTDQGEVPIEQVTSSHKVWDGESFVAHEGLIYQGIRNVIEYQGLIATPDHLVWVHGQPEPISFGQAAASGACLLQAGDGRHPIRVGADHQRCPHSSQTPIQGVAIDRGQARVYDLRHAGDHHRYTVSGHLVHNCGYQGGVGALKAMGALQMGLAEHELQPLVDAWRAANPNIVDLWAQINTAAIGAITTRTPTRVGPLTFSVQSGIFFIELPSKRRLAYAKPRLGENRFGGTSILYDGTMTGRKWGTLETYGGKLTENIVQAIARDLLVYGMHQVARAGHRIVMHVHDEIVVEAATASVEEICDLMATVPDWAAGLPLAADGYECSFYMKA